MRGKKSIFSHKITKTAYSNDQMLLLINATIYNFCKSKHLKKKKKDGGTR